jgi:hypothetical protein
MAPVMPVMHIVVTLSAGAIFLPVPTFWFGAKRTKVAACMQRSYIFLTGRSPESMRVQPQLLVHQKSVVESEAALHSTRTRVFSAQPRPRSGCYHACK